MAVDVTYTDNNVVVNSQTGVDGNAYTTAISNDKLTNDDFLKLLLEELKMQDPTKPMDSTAMMDSQLKMSTIEANADMSAAMAELSASYKTSNLSTAANMIDHIIEDGEALSDGTLPAYRVASVKQVDGEVIIMANKINGYDEDTGVATYDSNFKEIPLANVSKIF